MLKTRSYDMVRSSGNLIQWRKSLFDTVLVYNNKNKPMLRYKFGSVYVDRRFYEKSAEETYLLQNRKALVMLLHVRK